MPNSDFQRHSFLGGEVSPSLYERADMEKFGKWFSTAENIRFRETGAFRNRSGFVKVANTKYNLAGEPIKLLSFSFNDEESFLVELGTGYARFYRNGLPIMDGNAPYELQTPFTELPENDLKYAQAGDTIFIAHPKFGIYELARLQSDGSAWEFKKFNADIIPMKEENEKKNSTLSIAQYSGTIKKVSIAIPPNALQQYISPSFYYNSVLVFHAEKCSADELFNGIKDALLEISSTLNVVLKGDEISILEKDTQKTLYDFSITYSYKYYTSHTVFDYQKTYTATSITTSVSYAAFESLSSLKIDAFAEGYVSSVTVDLSSYPTLNQALNAINGQGSFSNEDVSNTGALVDTTNQTIYMVTTTSNQEYHRLRGRLMLTGMIAHTPSVTNNSTTESTAGKYIMTATDSLFFNKLQADDTILVKHAIDTNQLTGSYNAAGTYTLGPVRSDGNWRFYTLGNWKGNIVIQYSTDNQQTWVDYYEWSSQDTNDTPANINTSGSLIADDLVWFRVTSTVTATGTKPLQVFFTTNSFEINSYYKIMFQNSGTSAMVECVKNDIGLFTNNFQWRLPAFSNAEGWPQTVAFYQNRLFFGKDYIVYGSRSNDFWDFYEPIKLQADDPITMSLLSQKVNNIRNLVTQRSFFTFTAGGEFGIGSEGALTQNDKYLKPFSANGSAPCSPVLISDKVLFVDKSYNSIRALQYSLEADGYEAPDITLTLRALLENERIISTDIIYEEKEALFLSNTGTIWVLKYITDQNVLAWSHWKHAAGKITNICVVPNGAKHDLYIAVEDDGKKWIELLDRNEYMDTVEYFNATSDAKVSVTGATGDQKIIIQGNKRYKVVVDENGQVDTPEDTTASFKVGSAYVSNATMLAPVVQLSEYHHGNYEVKTPFKVFFYYLNSYGFKVGVEESEKMAIEWQPVNADIDDESSLTSGKKSVLIPSRFEGSARVSFVQEEPYPMEVADVLIQTDFGGK